MFFSKNVETNETQTEMSATSLSINSSTDVFQQFYNNCKLFSTTIEGAALSGRF